MGVFLWRGVLADSSWRQRTMVGSVQAVFSVALVFLHLGFLGVSLPGNHVAYVVTMLLPVALDALLLGTIAGTLGGLVAGLVMYVHSIVMPLDYHELALVTPVSSILLLGACGLLLGMLLYLPLREERALRWRIVGIVVTSVIVSWFFSLAFSAHAMVLLSHGTSSRLSGAEFAAVFDTDTVSLGERVFEMALQACADSLLLTLGCLVTDYWVQRLVRLKDDIGVRDAFGLSIFLVVLIAFVGTASVSYMSVTVREWQRAEASVRSEVNYLCLQLERLEERTDAFARLVAASGMDASSLSEHEAQDFAKLSDPLGDVIEGYTMAETGTVAIILEGKILATDDVRLPLGSDVGELLGPDIADAVADSVRTGELQRIPYAGVLATDGMTGMQVGGTQIAYLLAGQHGDYTVMIIEPAEMFFKNRQGVMVREAVLSLILLLSMFVLVSRLLSTMVARRIDETNETLGRITAGDLSARVEVSGTREFRALSAGINQTVEALNGWIAEAETRMDSELAAARAIQEAALPRTFPPFPHIGEFDLFASMDPAREVGGDFYDFFLIDDGAGSETTKLAFLIADVSGKGVPASLFMMKGKALIRDNLEKGLGLSESVANANRQLCDGNDAEMFVTAWVGILDYATGHVEYINAGHNPTLFEHEGSWQWLRKKSGMPLGVFDDLVYRPFSVDCSEGDAFLLYTDGVTEAFDTNSEQYGEGRLEAVATEHGQSGPRELLEAVRSDVAAFAVDAEQSDDITILTLKVLSVPVH